MKPQKRILGTALGRAFLEGAQWILSARNDPDLSVRAMTDAANSYAESNLPTIETALEAAEKKSQ